MSRTNSRKNSPAKRRIRADQRRGRMVKAVVALEESNPQQTATAHVPAEPATTASVQSGATPLTAASKLEELGIGARVVNFLLREGIVHVGDLADYSEDDLLDIRGFGDKSLRALKAALPPDVRLRVA